MLNYFKMFAHYNRWANGVVYAEAARLPREELNRDTCAFFGSLLGTLNHMLVADRIWLNRFTGTGPRPLRLDEVPFATLDALADARRAEDERIIAWVDGLDEPAIKGTFTYTPVTSPEPVTQRLGPALAHFFNHQTHHRGQAHMILTTLGRPSLALDLIYYQRSEEGSRWK